MSFYEQITKGTILKGKILDANNSAAWGPYEIDADSSDGFYYRREGEIWQKQELRKFHIGDKVWYHTDGVHGSILCTVILIPSDDVYEVMPDDKKSPVFTTGGYYLELAETHPMETMSGDPTIPELRPELMPFKIGDRVRFSEVRGGTGKFLIGTIVKNRCPRLTAKYEIDVGEGPDNVYYRNADELHLMRSKLLMMSTPFECNPFWKEYHGEFIEEGGDNMVKLESPKTKLEKDACKEAVKEVIKDSVEDKKENYMAEIRTFMKHENVARDYRKKADEIKEKLGLTKEQISQMID